ncbi:MAG: hypothetical protein IJF02_05570 [Oscillospiraceae bacterium]|nr:hypothetical protein [Oscillospiraceae bacterium]
MSYSPTQHNAKLDLASLLCKKIWKSTIDYIEATGSPQNSYYTTFFWTAFLYSVSDILDLNGITTDVQEQYVFTVAQLYDISMSDVERLADLKKYQRLAYQNLSVEQVDPFTKEGVSEILCIADIIITPEDEDIPNDPPDPTRIMEFMTAVTELTKYTTSLFSNIQKPPSQTVSHSPATQQNSTPKPTSSAQHNIPSKKPSKLSWYIVIPVLVIAVYICIGIVAHVSTLIDSADSSQTSDSDLIKIPEPISGHVFENTLSHDCVAPLTIETYGTVGYYFILDMVNSSAKLEFYVCGGDTVNFDVPLGTYEIYYATGEIWYGKDNLFGSKTIYQKCDDTFSFIMDAEGYSGWTIQLEPVSNGNLDTDIIRKEDFPK